jgi:hypothetical protein
MITQSNAFHELHSNELYFFCTTSSAKPGIKNLHSAPIEKP